MYVETSALLRERRNMEPRIVDQKIEESMLPNLPRTCKLKFRICLGHNRLCKT